MSERKEGVVQREIESSYAMDEGSKCVGSKAVSAIAVHLRRVRTPTIKARSERERTWIINPLQLLHTHPINPLNRVVVVCTLHFFL